MRRPHPCVILFDDAAKFMKTRQISISIVIAIAIMLMLYLTIASRLLDDRDALEARNPVPASTRIDTMAPAAHPAEKALHLQSTDSARAAAEPVSGGRKLLEIRGRIVDRDSRPIENALVAEEQYFHKARSDADGYYRLLLEIPRHRYPTLHFLRSGFAAQRIRLGKKQLQDQALYELDVTLDDALGTVTQSGWIGNEFGHGLEGARVELVASYARNRESYTLTEFSDADGNFEFEGIDAGQTYELSVDLAPEYPRYVNPDFQVTHDPARVDIVLRRLRFADIDGMIVNRESVPVPNYVIYISNISTGRHRRKIVSDSSGYFRLENFPLGEVSLTTRGSELFRTSGIVLGESSYQNLRITVDRGDNYLSGWIIDESGVAVAQAMVTLDRKFRSGALRHSSYRSQTTRGDGAFVFDSLGGGSYRLNVYAQGYEKQAMDYRFDQPSAEIFITLKRSPR